MTRSRSRRTLTIATTAILVASCSAASPQGAGGGGAGGSGPESGGATGGQSTTSGGVQGSGGATSGGIGGKGSGGNAAGGSAGPTTGGFGGSGGGGSGSGGAATGGSGSGGATGAGGSGSGGAATGGSGSGGATGTGGTGNGGAAKGGSGSGGATGTGGSGSGGTANGGSGSGGATGTGGTTGWIPTCPNISATAGGGPPALSAVPSPEQATLQHLEMTAFLHFGLATFDGTEQGNMSDKATEFNPTNLTQDTVNTWVSQLQAAGFKQAMLTAKHSTGFCLWPSASTNYCDNWSVKQSNWMNGSGDLVKMWTDAMHAAGMRVAMYLSPWDQHHDSTKSDYQTYYEKQITELLTNYGDVYEFQFDGYNAPGSHGDPATLDWGHVFSTVRKLQPHILIWAGPEVAGQLGRGEPSCLSRPAVGGQRERNVESHGIEPRPRQFGPHLRGRDEPLVRGQLGLFGSRAELVLAPSDSPISLSDDAVESTSRRSA